MAMASFIGTSVASQSQILYLCSPSLSPLTFISSPAQLRNQAQVRHLLPLRCLSSGTSRGTETESETTLNAPSTISFGSSNSTYNWRAGLGAIGLVDAAYLTYLKLAGSDVFDLLGSGSCGDVLSSDHVAILGVPLPFVGLIAYGIVTELSLQLSSKRLTFGISENSGRLLLLGITAFMAAASANLLYMLSTEFMGKSCAYCLISALLSFSLFFISLKDVGLQEIQKAVGLQICMASLLIATLSTSYSISPFVPSSLALADQPFHTTEITTKSSAFALSLAKHLQSIGAKIYGAFWCSHCLEQKQMFGREASKLLDYVECYPDGYKKGTNMIKACTDAKIKGFPSWIINDQVLSGEVKLEELAKVSGFNLNGQMQK